MTMINDRTVRAGSQHAIATRVAAILLAHLALLLTGCRATQTTADPIPSPEPSSHYSPLADPSGYADEYGGYTDDYGTYDEDGGGYPDTPSGYPDDPSDDYTAQPGGDTNPCAFPGDSLCPDTPITVPPPNLDPPW